MISGRDLTFLAQNAGQPGSRIRFLDELRPGLAKRARNGVVNAHTLEVCPCNPKSDVLVLMEMFSAIVYSYSLLELDTI